MNSMSQPSVSVKWCCDRHALEWKFVCTSGIYGNTDVVMLEPITVDSEDIFRSVVWYRRIKIAISTLNILLFHHNKNAPQVATTNSSTKSSTASNSTVSSRLWTISVQNWSIGRVLVSIRTTLGHIHPWRRARSYRSLYRRS